MNGKTHIAPLEFPDTVKVEQGVLPIEVDWVEVVCIVVVSQTVPGRSIGKQTYNIKWQTIQWFFTLQAQGSNSETASKLKYIDYHPASSLFACG
jgi:hypothetical protein